MNRRIQPWNGLSQKNKSAVTGWRDLESYFGPVNGLRISKRNRNSGGTGMRARPSQNDLRNSNEQLPQFKLTSLTRRPAICSVIEEKDQRHGISLAELRRQLIVRSLLIDVGMLWGSSRHIEQNCKLIEMKWTKYCPEDRSFRLNSQWNNSVIVIVSVGVLWVDCRRVFRKRVEHVCPLLSCSHCIKMPS